MEERINNKNGRRERESGGPDGDFPGGGGAGCKVSRIFHVCDKVKIYLGQPNGLKDDRAGKQDRSENHLFMLCQNVLVQLTIKCIGVAAYESSHT